MIISAVLLSAMLRGSAVPRVQVLPPARCVWVFVPPSGFSCLRPPPPIIHRRPIMSHLEVERQAHPGDAAGLSSQR
jgi:hypothetical protein